MSDCKCDLQTRLVGDGCEQCNPGMAVEMLQGAVEDLREEIARLRLTDAEREAIKRLLHWVADRPCSQLPVDVETDHSIACEVFERMGGGK